MYFLGVAGFFIAFAATAGAIPLYRNLFGQAGGHVRLTEGIGSVPPVAGGAMLFGLFLSLFYLDVNSSHAADLFVAGAFLGAAGLVLERAAATRGAGPAGVGLELIAALSAALGILVASQVTTAIHWTPSVVVAAVLIAATPASVSSLSRSRRATPALPTGVCLVQFLLLALLATLGVPGEAPAAGGLDDFFTIALPICGAAIGSLIYLCRMPWRAEAAITTSRAARLCLGLAVAWGALRLGGAFIENTQALTAIIWILCVPAIELCRPAAGGFAGSAFFSKIRVAPVSSWMFRGHTPVSIISFTLSFGLIGIAMAQVGLPETTSLALLMLGVISYVAWPALISPWTSAHRATFMDAGG